MGIACGVQAWAPFHADDKFLIKHVMHCHLAPPGKIAARKLRALIVLPCILKYAIIVPRQDDEQVFDYMLQTMPARPDDMHMVDDCCCNSTMKRLRL